MLNNRLNINAALFNIDWSNLPVGINGALGCSITNNIGEAQSQGVEFEAGYTITPELQVDFSASYTDTEWTEATAPVTKGESLVYSPKVNASLGLQYNFNLRDYPAFVRTDISYIGEYETSPKQFGYPKAGDYTKINLRAGISIDQWSMALYATNLTNYNDYTNFDGGGAIVATLPSPRKIGLEVSYSF